MPIHPGEHVDCDTIYRKFEAMRIKHSQHDTAVLETLDKDDRPLKPRRSLKLVIDDLCSCKSC